MTFWQKYENLCKEHNLTPSGAEMQKITGVSSAAITGWKTKGSMPKDYQIFVNLANYFQIDIRYLLGMTNSKHGEDIREKITDKLLDCGVDVYSYDNENGTGQEYVLTYKDKTLNCQEHEYESLCRKLLELISDNELYTIEKFCKKIFENENFDVPAFTKEEMNFLEKYQKLSEESKTIVNAALIQELRRQ